MAGPDSLHRLRQLIGSHTAGGHWDDGAPMSVHQVLGEATVGELAAAVHADLREQIAQEILSSPRIRPEQFAWLYYPSEMKALKEGMEHAAEIARGNVRRDPRDAGRVIDGG